MGDEMRSAFDRAWERAEKIEASPQALLELEYGPQGAKLAAAFLREGNYDLPKALLEFGTEARKYVVEGVQDTLLSNLNLPRNERGRMTNQKALEGLMVVKRDKSKLAQLSRKMDSLLAYYEGVRQEALEGMKKDFEPPSRPEVPPQLVVGTPPQGEERQRELQLKWQQILAELDMDYEGKLKMLKEEMRRIP
jgi:hypothetical protein